MVWKGSDGFEGGAACLYGVVNGIPPLRAGGGLRRRRRENQPAGGIDQAAFPAMAAAHQLGKRLRRSGSLCAEPGNKKRCAGQDLAQRAGLLWPGGAGDDSQ